MGLIVYQMEVVGGPFDGCGGMRWHDDGEHPVPELILMGVCPGNGSCGSREEDRCARLHKKHPYYWLPQEDAQPTRTCEYELSESFIEPEAPIQRRPSKVYAARAIYVIGGLQLPRERQARELVGAGAATGADTLRDTPAPVHAGYPGHINRGRDR
jgi:hypothetical protein